MKELGLVACNTWQNTEHRGLMCTRKAWWDGPQAQIDFLPALQDCFLRDMWVDHHGHGTTDHGLVCAELTKKLTMVEEPRSSQPEQQGGPENWEEWTEKVRDNGSATLVFAGAARRMLWSKLDRTQEDTQMQIHPEHSSTWPKTQPASEMKQVVGTETCIEWHEC